MSRPNEHRETCGCGASYQLKHKDRHLEKSAKHARWLENRGIVQNNTNNHVGQQTYYNNTNYNNYAEYPTYYNNVSYDYNDPYDFIFYGNEDQEHDIPGFVYDDYEYNPADQYDIPDNVYDDSDPVDQYDIPDNVYDDPEHVPDDQYDIPEGVYDVSEMLSEQERARYIGKLRTRDEKYG